MNVHAPAKGAAKTPFWRSLLWGPERTIFGGFADDAAGTIDRE
jgi:hypothetical protein